MQNVWQTIWIDHEVTNIQLINNRNDPHILNLFTDIRGYSGEKKQNLIDRESKHVIKMFHMF